MGCDDCIELNRREIRKAAAEEIFNEIDEILGWCKYSHQYKDKTWWIGETNKKYSAIKRKFGVE